MVLEALHLTAQLEQIRNIQLYVALTKTIVALTGIQLQEHIKNVLDLLFFFIKKLLHERNALNLVC